MKKLLEATTVLMWGKRKGKQISEVAITDPEYILILNRSKFFTVAEPVLKVAKNNLSWDSSFLLLMQPKN
jgi:hypothetical protein